MLSEIFVNNCNEWIRNIANQSNECCEQNHALYENKHLKIIRIRVNKNNCLDCNDKT